MLCDEEKVLLRSPNYMWVPSIKGTKKGWSKFASKAPLLSETPLGRSTSVQTASLGQQLGVGLRQPDIRDDLGEPRVEAWGRAEVDWRRRVGRGGESGVGGTMEFVRRHLPSRRTETPSQAQPLPRTDMLISSREVNLTLSLNQTNPYRTKENRTIR